MRRVEDPPIGPFPAVGDRLKEALDKGASDNPNRRRTRRSPVGLRRAEHREATRRRPDRTRIIGLSPIERFRFEHDGDKYARSTITRIKPRRPLGFGSSRAPHNARLAERRERPKRRLGDVRLETSSGTFAAASCCPSVGRCEEVRRSGQSEWSSSAWTTLTTLRPVPSLARRVAPRHRPSSGSSCSPAPFSPTGSGL